MKGKNIYKRIISFLIIISIIICATPNSVSTAAKAKKPVVQAKAYAVINSSTGKMIYSSKSNKKIYPASTAKLMTALVTLDKLKLDKKIKMTKKIKAKLPWDASALSLKTGAKYTVKQYLNMLLIASDANSAMALAIGTSGSVSKFSKLMNEKAKKIGMKGTQFDNPVGLDIGNGYSHIHTRADDMAKLAKTAMDNKVIRSIVKKSSYKVPKVKGSKSFVIHSTNKFYSTYKLKDKKYKVVGTKTGTTNAAGHCLVATVKASNGNEIIVCYFGANSNYELYTGITKLVNYTFKHYKF